MTSKLTIEQAKRLRNDFECWQQDYDPKYDKEQYDMFGRGMAAMDMLIAGMYQEPVAWKVRFKLEGQPGSNFNKFFDNRKAMNDVVSLHELGGFNIDVTPLYRHAQQPVVQKIMAHPAYLLDEDQFHNIESMVLAAATQPAAAVPDDVLDALQKVARIRLDLNDFDGDRRGIVDCLGDAEEALIEVVNRRAAMLNGGKS
ncbi:hypothetical protein [Klebsiella michiganensis]|uniref:hypothetical protein n=1 Tax=Klebsiella michiganensis TaxID=1134687 RepID=UPI00222586F7|nr:hypothetical protein [Klebsiella michiganensis]UYY75205.1 hypothetical protein OKE89_13245 [Klebsiella michiganensis]